MRPTRLDLEGFASFRQPTTVDFTEADLFVLSGPTGSGKTSIIDAITFCLYGTVARYNDRRLVEPIISKGRNEARVSLQFTVGDVGYTAVRVVRRTKSGASTKEARLEKWRDKDPADAFAIAGTADEVSTTVHELLGLGYEHFTRTVVLPQGAFQRFLHGSQKERSDLLNELLAVGVFDTVASAARTRASSLDLQIAQLQTRLDGDLTDATPEQVAAAAADLARLATAIDRIDVARPGLDAILTRGRELAQRNDDVRTQLAVVQEITKPAGLDDLVTRADERAVAVTTATSALATTEQQRDEADAAVDDLPSTDAIVAQQRHLTELVTASQAVDQVETDVAAATTEATQTTAAAATAEQELEQAMATVEAARRGDLVAALATGLHAGDDCPVCARPLDTEIDVDGSQLVHAQQQLGVARTAAERARVAASSGASQVASAKAAQTAAVSRHTQLRQALEDSPLPTDDTALATLAATVTAAATRRVRARTAVAAARSALTQAESGLRAVQEDTAAATSALTTARDQVAAQGPPAVDPTSLGTSWAALTAWATQRSLDLTVAITEADEAVAATRTDYRQALAALRSELSSLEVTTADGNQIDAIRDDVVQQRARAVTRHEELVRRQQQRAATVKELATRRNESAVAETLGRLLDKRNFQRWLTARAMGRLVIGATRHLQQLTDGAYGLAVDDGGEFAIVDHANASELRPARSLSGGETFLASLSLALALSEQITDLAAGGAARLESLFIDEGFGTLDAATIDVVRAALEELGATGRMVGVVTHVPSLAEQLPVQFRVRKEAQTSVVERIDM